MKAILAVVMTGLVVWAGCGEDEPPGWRITVKRLYMLPQYHSMCGYGGEPRNNTIRAFVQDMNGVPIPGVRVDFQIRNPLTWKGTIHKFAQDTLTDTNGVVRALYQVTFAESGHVGIFAVSSLLEGEVVLAEDTIRLAMVPDNAFLLWGSDTVTFDVWRDSSVTIFMQTRLTDSTGNNYSDVRLEFKPWPGTDFKGTVTPDTTLTGQDGIAGYQYKSEPNQYGDFMIMGCSFGDTIRTVMRVRER